MSWLTRDETAEPVSRDQILRRERGQGNIHFPCLQLPTSRIGNLTLLIVLSLYVKTIPLHTVCPGELFVSNRYDGSGRKNSSKTVKKSQELSNVETNVEATFENIRPRRVKTALCTIVSRSPFFFLYSKILPVTKQNKMRLNVCFNEMAPFGPFAAFIKGCSTYERDDRNGGQPTRRDG